MSVSGDRKLRWGYTTGSCAAAAAKAAAILLLTDAGPQPFPVEIRTPGGKKLSLVPEDIRRDQGAVSCGIRKDAGDDPDITNGVLVYARVEKNAGPEILILGGEGVGRVTKPGLDAAVGEAAINRTPRRMIREAAAAVCAASGYTGGLTVTISIPGGEALAERTFNPKLGIVGGLSILGTTGIVEPMSDRGFIGTIKAEYAVRRAQGERTVVIAPGNYGRDFLAASPLAGIEPVLCSNFIGDALDLAAEAGFECLLLAGHIGKLVKLATGNFNTHSKYGDPRLEILTAYAALEGAPRDLLGEILHAAVTEQAVALLEEAGLWPAVLRRLLGAVQDQIDRRCRGKLLAGALLFSTGKGLLGLTETAHRILSGIAPRKEGGGQGGDHG
ncbi:MAG: cobalt-precorrin-5B (C(1))-methyltransferase CbiD [Spirochaetaceae bacterium]|jgi:cobalt-precorrin-5B (C1)-methyltransferase|nr:cobalt-precorrin-5B (C(1))-methyltransferase CbiD [Spirochaetaceae bacterium]